MKKISSYLILAVIAAAITGTLSDGSVAGQFPCGVVFSPYNLNNEPDTLGLSAGEYEAGKRAFVGLGSFQSMSLTAGRLQISPPGILLPINRGVFTNTSVWYLRPNQNQVFSWVPSQNGRVVPFAVDFGTSSRGTPYYFGRVRRNNFVMLGVVRLFMGKMIFVDQNGRIGEISTGYEVLTCTSSVTEEAVPLPSIQNPPPNNDVGCIHNWVAYNNNAAPNINGISAGPLEQNNIAYIGKSNLNGPFRPGRIQTTPTPGLYILDRGEQVTMQSGGFYLADNKNYTYTWITYMDSLPRNAVKVRNNVSDLAFGIARQRINGRVRIGMYLDQSAYFPDNNGKSIKFDKYFDVLVCDPVPKYKCSQIWKPYNNDGAPSRDGFAAGRRNNMTVYIGRGKFGCVNCEFNIGRIEILPSNISGAFYTSDLSPNEIFDNITAEYLVRNKEDIYEWRRSYNGMKVRNAIGSVSGQNSYYIGMTIVDHQVLIGKVRPNEGLFYSNINGTRTSTNVYTVLTCHSTKPYN